MDDALLMALKLAAVLALVLANAFFVAAEFALVSVRKSRMESLAREGDAAAQGVLDTLGHLDHYIAATQLGITLASLMLGWIGDSALVHLFEAGILYIPYQVEWITPHTAAATLAFMLITFMHVVLGELVPKSLALQHPDETAMWVARPMRATAWIMRPAVAALNGTGNAVLRLLGLPPASGHTSVHSVDELKILMDDSHRQGILAEQQKDMLTRVFSLQDLTVRQVMVHRLEIVAVEDKASLEEVRTIARDKPHSRYPVYQENLDHIIGLLHIKDLITLSLDDRSFDLMSLVRPALWVPETLPVEQLLVQLRRARTQVAMVLDEFGGTSGMVTLQDVTSELLGDLVDEFDADEDGTSDDASGRPVVEGRSRLDEINEAFALELEDEEVDTLGGYVIKLLGKVPSEGDYAISGGVRFTVVSMDGRRIRLVQLSPENPEMEAVLSRRDRDDSDEAPIAGEG